MMEGEVQGLIEPKIVSLATIGKSSSYDSVFEEPKSTSSIIQESASEVGGVNRRKEIIRLNREAKQEGGTDKKAFDRGRVHPHDAHDVEGTPTRNEAQRRGSVRSNQLNDRWEQVRDKVRRSLEVPAKTLKKFSVRKENIRQQALPNLWEPIWDCKSVGRLLLILAILTLLLALVIFFVHSSAKEYRFTFEEECKNSRNHLRLVRSICAFCARNLNPYCSKVVEIPEDLHTPVFLYYELIGFHQNHRKLTRAMDDKQLLGKIFTDEGKAVDPSKTCGDVSRDGDGKIYFPCGQLANLMYSDDFTLETAGGELVDFRINGIAHSVLKRFRFKNPPTVTPLDYNQKPSFNNFFVKPKDWSTQVWQNWWKNGGLENERFINWMNPSALAHLRKLYAVIDSVPGCSAGVMCKGSYTMKIEYRFDTERYEGSKAFIIATTSFFGGVNHKLPLLVGIVGFIELILGMVMLYVDRFAKKRRRQRRKQSERSTDQRHITLNLENVSPRLDANKSVSVVTTFAITSQSDVGILHGSGIRPSEGLMAKPVSILYRNDRLATEESYIVFPDDYNKEVEENPSLVFYSSEENESGLSDSESFTSSDELISAASESFSENDIIDDVDMDSTVFTRKSKRH